MPWLAEAWIFYGQNFYWIHIQAKGHRRAIRH